MINKIQITTLGFLSLFLSGNALQAQKNVGPEQSFHDKIQAATVIKRQADFNLKGNIENLKEICTDNNDSLVFHFNRSGVLEKKFIPGTKEFTLYTFDNNQLSSIYFTQPEYTLKTYFSSYGYIEKQIVERINFRDTFHQESNYNYSEKSDKLNISYKYNIDTTRWDVVLNDSYMFTYNEKNQVIRERKISRHTETTYENSVNYFYDSTSENLIYLVHIDACALTLSSNSCANYSVRIAYDNHNNIISKSLADRTIRNAIWSDSYAYSAKYNGNYDIIEESYVKDDGSINAFRDLLINPEVKDKEETGTRMRKQIFEYEYDKSGNWIKKYELSKNKRKLITSRIIEYYK